MAATPSSEERVRATAAHYLRAWGESSVPPTVLATFITAQHARPFQFLPMIFPPVLLFSTYVNLNGFKKDAAGTTAAWSGLYMVLAMRRKQRFAHKFGARGLVRGITLGLCAVNIAGCGLAYVFGRREQEERERNQ